MNNPLPMDELFAGAMEQSEGPERDSWIVEACAGDESVERELRDMLAANATGSWFMAEPVEKMPGPDAPPPTTIGAFRIEGEIGRGGMGVVYRAIDTRLDRIVAIKALPAYMASDPRRMARFEQEAKTLATLNHANVAAIYGLEEVEGRKYLILEFVDGLTLEERLRKGRLPIDETLTICAQIAAGVVAAHDTGVIHRDLKPANIKITPSGEVKVLDFGLAKMSGGMEPKSRNGEPSDGSPKMPSHASPVQTIEGAIMGTAAYMSPEQARGRKVDHRTDVWSFGIILHECLTGVSYFRTTTAADSINAILNKPITFEGLPPETTPVLRHILQRCLERDRNKRIRDMHDVRLALEHDSSTMDLSFIGQAPKARFSGKWTLIAALVLITATMAIGFFSGRGSVPPVVETPRPVAHLFAPATFENDAPILAITPDGRNVAYIGRDGQPEDPPAIYLRDLESVDAQRLQGTDHVIDFSFSPDGSHIAFFWGDPTSNRFELRVLKVGEGRPVTLLNDSRGDRYDVIYGRPGWLSDSQLVILSKDMFTMYRVPLDLRAGMNDTYEPEVFAEFDRGGSWITTMDPLNVPGQEAVIVSRFEQTSYGPLSSLFWVDEDGVHEVLKNAKFGIATRSGHLIFNRSLEIAVMSFDLETGTVSGEPVTLFPEYHPGRFSYSDDGIFVMSREFGSDEKRRLMSITRNGERTPLSTARAEYNMGPIFSSDGRKMVVGINDTEANATRLHVVDMNTGDMQSVPTPPDGASMSGPIWMPDGRISFVTYIGPSNMKLYAADVESGQVELLLGEDQLIGGFGSPTYTPDGRYVLFHFRPHPRWQDGIYIMALDGTMDRQPFLTGDPRPGVPRLSPDGRWLAYKSGSNVIVQPFDLESDQSQDRQVIANARIHSWSFDSTELFFLQPGTNHVMGVRITADPDLTLSKPQKLVDHHAMNVMKQFDIVRFNVHPDGRFVYIAEPEGGPDPHLHIVMNFDTELKSKLPLN
ncbi:MAG: protein kinase [Planctomycetota bacterium]|nr:protein kinase [Planctomycetota bacterium]